MSSNSDEKLDFKRLLPILVIVLVDLLGLTIIIPLLPIYAASFGASPMMIGVMAAMYPIMQFIGAPILGRLSDRYGRKPVLVISQFGTLIGFIMLGMANALPLILLSRIIDGISGANIATARAAITDSTSERNRTQGLGLIGAAFGLGFTIGPVIAFLSLAFSDNNYHIPAFVAAAFSLASILLTVFWFKETLPEDQRGAGSDKPSLSLKSFAATFRHPTVGFLLVLMFVQQLAFGGFEQLLALFTLNVLGLSAKGNALIFVFIGILVVVVQGGLIGKWSRRYGDRRLVYVGMLLLAGGLIMMAFTPSQPLPGYSQAALTSELTNTGQSDLDAQASVSTAEDILVDLPDDGNTGVLGLLWLLVAMIPLSIGGGILRPSINSLITKGVEHQEVGGVLGVASSSTSAANAIAPLIGGLFFQLFGPRSPFIVGGLVVALLAVVSLQRLRATDDISADTARGDTKGHSLG